MTLCTRRLMRPVSPTFLTGRSLAVTDVARKLALKGGKRVSSRMYGSNSIRSLEGSRLVDEVFEMQTVQFPEYRLVAQLWASE